MQLLLAGSFAFGVLLIFAALANSMSKPSRVNTIANQYARPVTLEEMQFSQPFTERALLPILRQLASWATRFAPQQVVEETRKKLEYAGNPFELPVAEFWGLRLLAAVLTALVMALVFTLLHYSAVMIFLFSIVGLVLGFYLPILWLDMKIRQRKEDIQLALPDALDLLTVCVEAGMGLDAAIGQVVDKWNNQLSRAFARSLRELRLGRPRAAVMRDMSDRAGVRDLTNFVAAIIQAEQHGSPIASVLRVQSEQMRVLRRQRAQEKANQMAVKMLFPLVFFMVPPMFIVLLGPAVIRLMNVFK